MCGTRRFSQSDDGEVFPGEVLRVTARFATHSPPSAIEPIGTLRKVTTGHHRNDKSHFIGSAARAAWTDARAVPHNGGSGEPAGPDRFIGFARRSDAARQVSDLIRADVVAGRYSGPLPNEWDLLPRYGTSRNVLRAALALLKDQGVITRSPRAGTFGVMPVATVTLARTAKEVAVYGEAVTGNSFDSPRLSIQHLSVQLVDAPETVRRNLEMEAPRAFFIESLISFDGEPNRLRSSWVPEERSPGLLEGGLVDYVPDAITRELGERTRAQRLLLSALNSDMWTAELLGIPAAAAIFLVERLLCLPDGTPIEYGFSRYRGDRAVIDTMIV
jgi:GntR family transcriptional regulator